jgi:hypothetical protein
MFSFVVLVLGKEPRAWHMLDKHPVTKLHPQANIIPLSCYKRSLQDIKAFIVVVWFVFSVWEPSGSHILVSNIPELHSI